MRDKEHPVAALLEMHLSALAAPFYHIHKFPV
jgi:hypothetical protein